MVLPLANPIFFEALQRGLIVRATHDVAPTDPRYNPYGVGFESSVSVVAVGPAQFVVFPGEAFPELGLRIKSHMSGSTRFFVGLGNDELGYIMDEDEYAQPPHEYEATMCVGPGTGLLLQQAVLDLLAQ